MMKNNKLKLLVTLWILVCGLWPIGYNSASAEDFSYNSKGRRDPFVPLVGPGAVYQVKEAVDITSTEDVELEGIVYDSKGVSRAIVNSIVLKEGDQAGVLLLEKVDPGKIVIRIDNIRYEVYLSGEKSGGETK